ncbi:MAG TPA: sugar phosphate isomerase/epimerase family protein [Terriglobia bacterium]|nr:sugar phosphate isomerase/epimerase family protein [Terriglobia bacterium]
MQKISRREFLERSAMGVAVAGCLSAGTSSLGADPLGIPIGFQIYPVREKSVKDFKGTLQEMAAAGYRAIELCSFSGYDDFSPLAKMKAPEVRQTLKTVGLHCESCHYTPEELKTSLEDRVNYAKELGLKYMILSSFGLKRDATLDDWKRAANDLNKAGEKTKQAGIQLGYHNHDMEFKELNGVLIYDELMKQFDAKLIKMQFQCAVVSIGYDPVTYLSKYPGRFCSLHVADWSSKEKKMVPVGQGVIDWKKLFVAAKAGGVRNYFVEMDKDLMKASVPYLNGLKV